ncbi:hypothetical protein SULI_13870 [Saccharolobus solfataricus]|nr:hypothetical protein [Saccharolobus solfataricus]AKA75150.1 hypothetical protein SULB_2722 [Saccharolobus solfataricus]AKA77842.1 hypothetical protein SULC_2719 [Saccharolobus solfataricus]AKA80538.1 hypothetical protein SULA_2721 [Saccharolobus solfataricus]AZF69586.1 hypothetical protein SULG_13870 [Saccharolobus solfataricus]AZF72206.1 hypothetical protein SULH_13870 [Saccharolobus solfataricus]
MVDIAKCFKGVEDFITSSAKNKRWEKLWNIIKECEKINFFELNIETLIGRCVRGELEVCEKLGLNNEQLKKLVENPYVVNFSFIMVDIFIKEFLDLILITSYLEPLNTITRYSISSESKQSEKELLDDAVENQDKIMSFLEVKVQVVKNLIENNEFVENLNQLYEILGSG